ncbi:10245_t:CDS:1 [Ambispora leptoticha]|uniref:10245_t:CDS:1 n=1 Tax=Ambispora leptoticha TaxID=144679 RepID=A0A9N9HAT1_9GLOM|nr:10245_t:CDS:1 [Ambispora leptoticha]
MTLLQPPKSAYSKASQKIWFTYAQNANCFQQGLLGLTDSYIAGNLYLRFPEAEPLKAKRIEVSITGTEYVHWTEQVLRTRCVYDASTNTYRTVTYYETIHYLHEQQILNRSLLLWESKSLKDNGTSNKKLPEKITKMNLPFQLSLPDDLPPSMNLVVGRIYYNVNAKIKRKRNFWKFQGSNKSVKCSCLITRYSPMPMPAPVRWVEWDNSKAWKRGVGYNISMAYDTFGPGNPIIVKLALKFLKPDSKIKELFVGLKEYNLFRASGATKLNKGYVKERRILGNQFPKILNAKNEWSSVLRIDALDKVSWTTERYHINVYHKVKIKIRFGIFGPKNVNLERKVNIENIANVSNYEYKNSE